MRRVSVLHDIDLAQEVERQRRRRWAVEVIEKERSERISDQFLATLASTQWFSDMISAYHEDYEIVCPYYRIGAYVCMYVYIYTMLVVSILYVYICCLNACMHVGCRAKCRRSDIQQHLSECPFAGEGAAAELRYDRTSFLHVSVIILTLSCIPLSPTKVRPVAGPVRYGVSQHCDRLHLHRQQVSVLCAICTCMRTIYNVTICTCYRYVYIGRPCVCIWRRVRAWAPPARERPGRGSL